MDPNNDTVLRYGVLLGQMVTTPSSFLVSRMFMVTPTPGHYTTNIKDACTWLSPECAHEAASKIKLGPTDFVAVVHITEPRYDG